MVVTFFGHRDTPPTIWPALQSQIELFIKNHDNCFFMLATTAILIVWLSVFCQI